jgi:malate synthase
VHDNSKQTTLPISREVVKTYVESGVKLPWFIDLLNINLGNHDLAEAKRRIQLFIEEFGSHSRRVTGNIDFDAEGSA